MNKLEEMKYTFNKNIMLRNLEKTTLVYNNETSDMYELNEVGADLFSILQRNTSMEAVFMEVCEMYDVCKDDVYDDVEEFVTRMAELGIVISSM